MKYLAFALVLVVATCAFGFEKKAYQMRDDFGTEPLVTGCLQYYYYIPCPTSSWFWAYTGWDVDDYIGQVFTVGDQGMGPYAALDPMNYQALSTVRILDFAGYGTVYPGLFTIEMDVWCPPCPLFWLGGTGPIETGFAWNYIDFVPPISICPCFDGEGLSFVVTMHFIGSEGIYPAVGMDNISGPLGLACEMHDYGCLPAVWPRAAATSGYMGLGDPCLYYPPASFCDGADTTPDCSVYGLIEFAWRAYIECWGPTDVETSTWGNIKSMYQ